MGFESPPCPHVNGEPYWRAHLARRDIASSMPPEGLTVIGLFLDIVGVVLLFYVAPEKFPDPQAGVSFALEGDDRKRREQWRKRQPTRRRLAAFSVVLIILGFGLQLLGELFGAEWLDGR